MRLEREGQMPFKGDYTGLGGTSADSAVGLVRLSKREVPTVLKWNRKHIATAQEAGDTALFISRSITLYREALGDEFIIPTSIAVGLKTDNGLKKYKVYTHQPYIEGWTAKIAPDEVLQNRIVTDQWNILNSRLFHLYNVSAYINSTVDDPQAVFPITLTLGSSRKKALIGEPGQGIPKTPNILIDKTTLRLGLCDFGEYIPWNSQMQGTYNQIQSRLRK